MKSTFSLILALALVPLLHGCAPPPTRPDLPNYSATALHTAVLANQMYHIMLPEMKK